MKVPFVDLHAQYVSIKSEIDAAIADTIARTAFIGGEPVSAFEKDFASWLGVSHCIACANGTDSIEILLKAVGIGVGDEVIVPAHSWISTSEAVGTVGAMPVFADTLKNTFTIDPADVRKRITNRTKAIIPVHLFGLPAEMDVIMDIAKEFNLKVIEDCAQSHGAKFKGQLTGTFGHAASFSFYPGKNLGAYGDAGAMVTNDAVIADAARMIANHGQKGKHNHIAEGRNSRLDGLQAAILSVKLKHLDKWNSLRIEKANVYTKLLKNSRLVLPQTPKDHVHVFHLYVVQLPESVDRKQVMEDLKQNGIETAVHYPVALPFLKPYSNRNFSNADFPVARTHTQCILSLPIFAEITVEQQRYVADTLQKLVS